MNLRLTESTVEGFRALVVESEDVKLVILPQLGAKIVSLIWKPTGFEYLWRHPGRPLRLATYGANFEAGDISGWDECFPSIGQCYYAEAPWSGILVPDHGELWVAWLEVVDRASHNPHVGRWDSFPVSLRARHLLHAGRHDGFGVPCREPRAVPDAGTLVHASLLSRRRGHADRVTRRNDRYGRGFEMRPPRRLPDAAFLAHDAGPRRHCH